MFPGLGDNEFLAPIVLSTEVSPSYLETARLSGGFLDDLVALGYGGIAAFRNSHLGGRVPFESVLNNSTAVLRALASGYGPLTFQWRKDGVPLADGGPISGRQTATLTIDPVAFADAGSYDVVVTDSCGSRTSNAADTLRRVRRCARRPLPSTTTSSRSRRPASPAGCGGGNYCPTSPVRRDQMAVFLLKAKHGADYTPPACTGVFRRRALPVGLSPTGSSSSRPRASREAAAADNYCPDASVTRAQMAVFLLKTQRGLRLHAARGHGNLRRRAGRTLRRRLHRGPLHPRHHRRLLVHPAALLPRATPCCGSRWRRFWSGRS